jgi:prepilin-type N-terminal cleavage/methylation domain-containing protein
MNKREESGFTLIELMVTMAVFVLVMVAAANVLTGMITQFKQQSKTAESNIEGIVGLEILRQDLGNAGYALPWSVDFDGDGVAQDTEWALLTTYYEAAGAAMFNDGDPASPLPLPAGVRRAPRAVFSDNDTGMNESDYLVIKSVSAQRTNATERWAILKREPIGADNPWTWTPAGENLTDTDRVIVLQYRDRLQKTDRLLMTNGTAFYTTFDELLSSRPRRREDPSNIVYGLAPEAAGTPRMPFNRADYYIDRPADISPRCAPSTGILYKATLQHATGSFTVLPLLDCVVDMQVTFLVDADASGEQDGIIDWPPVDTLVGLNAEQIRNRVREIRVYVVAQEGQKDTTYDFSEGGTRENLSVIEVYGADSRTIDFTNIRTLLGDTEYKYYKWKIYTIAVTPNNLR